MNGTWVLRELRYGREIDTGGRRGGTGMEETGVWRGQGHGGDKGMEGIRHGRDKGMEGTRVYRGHGYGRDKGMEVS